jgi:hypothetical protein
MWIKYCGMLHRENGKKHCIIFYSLNPKSGEERSLTPEINHHHHHQPINVPTGAQAFLMGFT